MPALAALTLATAALTTLDALPAAAIPHPPPVSSPSPTLSPSPSPPFDPPSTSPPPPSTSLFGPSSPSSSRPRYAWPLAPPHHVLRQFRPPATPYGPGHRGVDLGAADGEPVLAAADGLVSFAGWLATRGVVAVTHAGGVRTTYEPVRPEVATGQWVRRGEEVGRLMPGHEGCPAGCLHWGARRGGEYVDPLRLLSTQRVRLLPWREPPPAGAT
jgi:murein DD-endopeptidase MepM/ murein hydrolase activator NlpD